MKEEKLSKSGELNSMAGELDSQALDDLVEEAVATVANLNGIRVFDYLPDGLYLTVFPPKGEGQAITAEAIYSELAAQGVKEYAQEAILETVDLKNGLPVKIAEAKSIKPVPGQVIARVSQDAMEAYIKIIPPRHGGPPVTLEKAREALTNLGVVHGIDTEKVQRAVDLGNSGEEVPVAAGTPVEMGINAQLKYNFETGGIKVQPKELADGRVDFYNLNLIQNIVTGQVLVTKTLPTSGKDGLTVTGKVIPAKPGKDVMIKAGKNTELLDNNSTLIATDNGHVVLAGGKVSVLPIYEVNGDVNFSTGNIDFVGNVIVKGNVTEGFIVRSQGDVEIRGSIAGGSVVASGHIQVKNGIQGVGKGTIQCGGNIFTKFIENAKVKADGDIIVGEAIMHSHVYAKGSIQVGGRKGVIVGGVTSAGTDITAKIVGSNFSTHTELEAGVNPELRDKYNETVKNLEEAKKNLDKTQKAFILLKNMEKDLGELPTDKKAMLVKVSRAQFQLFPLVEALNEQVKQLNDELESANRGKVNISGLIHPGVKITIVQAVYYVADPMQFTSFIREKGEIKLVPLK